MVFPLKGFGLASLILVYGRFLSDFEACTCVIASVIYMGIKKNSADGLVYYIIIANTMNKT